MKFDKSRIYTDVNADELKVGSKVYVADCLADLQREFFNACEDRIYTIVEILSPSNNPRFKAKTKNGAVFYWHLAYLIEEPDSLKWSDLKIGDIIKTKNGRKVRMVTGVDIDNTELHIVTDMYISDEELAEKWEKV